MSIYDEILDRLQDVDDPELGISILDLGLIRQVDLDEADQRVSIAMTLTTPSCPMAPELMQAVAHAACQVDGITKVDLSLDFNPLWDPRIDPTEDGKAELGIWG